MIDFTRSGHRPRRDCFSRNCYRFVIVLLSFCYRFVIVLVSESWTIFETTCASNGIPSYNVGSEEC